jgi:thioredoxin
MKKTIITSMLAMLLLSTMAQVTNLTLVDFVKKINAAADPQILDARSPEEFGLNHLKGAINIDLKDSVGYEKEFAKLNKANPVFVYSINNGRSSVVAGKLKNKGFKEVYELPGGLANWVGSGNPIETLSKKGVSVSLESFHQIIKSGDLVLVDFGSKYCGSCRKVQPILDSLERNYTNSVKIVRIEMYDNPELVKDLKVQSLPTLILYKNGNEAWGKTGIPSYAELATEVKQLEGRIANTSIK